LAPRNQNKLIVPPSFVSSSPFPEISAIAAVAENRVISFQNKLPWKISEDLRWFRGKTKGNTLLIGRKTFESMGGATALPDSKIIVLSHGGQKFEGADTLTDWRNLKPDQIQGTLFIGGGQQVYEELLPYTRYLFLTHVFQSPIGDRYFPQFENRFTQQEVLREEPDKFKIVVYENKNPLPFPARTV